MSIELEEVMRCDVCRRSTEDGVEDFYCEAGHKLGCKHDICDRCMTKIWSDKVRECPACKKEKETT